MPIMPFSNNFEYKIDHLQKKSKSKNSFFLGFRTFEPKINLVNFEGGGRGGVIKRELGQGSHLLPLSRFLL